jgi:para-aminobenzoate synthetase component 1
MLSMISVLKTGAAAGTRGVLEVELGADELVGALLGLAPGRRLHLLDSGGARGDEARFLVAGFDPLELVEAFGEELRVFARGRAGAAARRGSVLSLLDERLAAWRAEPAGPGAWTARGACFVSLSYELARQFARLRSRPPLAARREPEAVLAFFDALVVHDYARGRTFVTGVEHSGRRLAEMRDTLLCAARDAGRREGASAGDADGLAHEDSAGPPLFEGRSSLLPAGVTSNFTRGEYERAVERVRRHIFAGDIYQANLTQQLTCRPAADASPERVFRRLRRQHPASFAAFVRRGESTVVSASPERFMRVGAGDAGRVVEAWPIKGTRARGRDAEEDARLRAELMASAKDRAENVMIVDLMRNDLGRVCRYGSVEVVELCAAQEHPTLFHLVSKVRGRLRGGVTAGELLRAAFPCGSVTGAPKLRAMEIIDGVETVPRGISMGSIGYFAPDGSADLNVAIRTITFDASGTARFNVGGGIVADSDPSDEYEETLVKARALLRALRSAE